MNTTHDTIARVISRYLGEIPPEFVAELSRELAKGNPNFDQDAFIERCCMKPPTVAKLIPFRPALVPIEGK